MNISYFRKNIICFYGIVFCLIGLVSIFGCYSTASNNHDIKKGMSEAQLISNMGQPDVIKEVSGDVSRFYGHDHIPENKRSDIKSKTLYYRNKQLAIVIEQDQVVAINSITSLEWSIIRITDDK